MYETGVKLLIKTWSRGTNSRLPLGVNVNLNLSIFVLSLKVAGIL